MRVSIFPTVLLLVSIVSAQATGGSDVRSVYDKFRDRTVVGTKPYPIKSGLVLNVAYEYRGKTLTHEPETFLLMVTTGRSSFLRGDMKAYFIADGRRIALSPFNRDARVLNVGIIEQLFFEISREDLEALADARSLEMRLGRTEAVTLKPALRSRIRKFLDFFNAI